MVILEVYEVVCWVYTRGYRKNGRNQRHPKPLENEREREIRIKGPSVNHRRIIESFTPGGLPFEEGRIAVNE